MAKAIKSTPPKKSLFTLKDSNRKKLKIAAAVLERPQQDIVNEALEQWFDRLEKKSGKLPGK